MCSLKHLLRIGATRTQNEVEFNDVIIFYDSEAAFKINILTTQLGNHIFYHVYKTYVSVHFDVLLFCV